MAAYDKKKARKGDGLMAMEQACDKVACGMALGSPLALMPLGLPAQH
jgi:hypothetical protein